MKRTIQGTNVKIPSKTTYSTPRRVVSIIVSTKRKVWSEKKICPSNLLSGANNNAI